MAVPAAQARSQLTRLIAQVNDDQEAVEILSKKGTVYLVPADEYRSWRETMYLLASPANAARLHASIAEHQAGETTGGPLPAAT